MAATEVGRPPHEVAVDGIDVAAFTVPTDAPESDGTAQWDATTIVVVEAHAGGHTGLGYTYGNSATGTVIESVLRDVVAGRDAMAVGAAWEAMGRACRNLGRPGVASMAIAAVDTALWDLKARLLDLPLATVLDAVRTAVPVYGSGGFTSYDDGRLAEQLGGWAEEGIPRVKMKVGRDPGRDVERMRVARDAVGPDVQLFVDANGALSRKEALAFAARAAERGVTWLEEPVSSDDLEGLRLVRDRAPAGMDVAAGEYGYMLPYFQGMLAAGAVDCLQADVTRCEGITGFLNHHPQGLPTVHPSFHLHRTVTGRFSASQMRQSSPAPSFRSTSSRVTTISPGVARRTRSPRPGSRSRSYGWVGCPSSSIT